MKKAAQGKNTRKPDLNKENKPLVSEPVQFVAIGASAGGLEAIEIFFSNMPPDSGMAFIVIQHLSPDYKSLMVELLSKKTLMPVLRAEEGMLVQANHVYLIPPKKNLTIFHGRLLLSEQDHSRGVNLPIDLFFRSLAEDQNEKAIAVILSGTGSDGTRGLRSIKENGGMVMVQEEDTAKFNGMPRAAISTGLVDFILPPDTMPRQLLSFSKHPYVVKSERTDVLLSDEEGMTRIFALLREKCKVDFTFYKPSTITRRIERRMTVNQTDNIKEYVNFLQQFPGEVNALYRELLIGVTSFFRDPEAFDALLDQAIVPLLAAGNNELRFWVAACSTGEEAYSLAILLKEAMETTGMNRDVKIFATDIDRDAIQFAAAGVYPESIMADVNPRYLMKYFHRRDDNFQITRAIREMVVFAQHNLVRDPPFTNISLISCRNILIYLQAVLQRKVIDFFNFSLVPGGVLFLGTSETVGEMAEYFDLVDHKNKIYRSKGRLRQSLESPLLAAAESRTRDHQQRYTAYRRAGSVSEEERILEKFLDVVSGEYLPFSLIINEHLEVLQIIGNSESYLKFPSGKVVNDLSKLVQKELAIPISTGVQKVLRQNQELRFSNIRLHVDGVVRILELRIKPLKTKKNQEPLLAVLIGEVRKTDMAEQAAGIQSFDLTKEAEDHLKEMEQELQFTRENLQATIEELETSNEELQATNEELLASNEELQSTNEELQSTNEELFTVNAEYQSKIIELTELHNDVDNLLSNNQIGQLILDENMEVRHYSTLVTKIFRLIASDIGRPISHISHFISGFDPIEVINQVTADGGMFEKEILLKDGEVFLMRVVPYLVGPKIYSGTVLSFIDISALRKAEKELNQMADQYRYVFENMLQGAVFQDATGKIVSANKASEEILGLTRNQILGRDSLDPRWATVFPDGTPLPGTKHPAMTSLKTGKPVIDYIMGVSNPLEKGIRWIRVNAIPQFVPGQKKPEGVFTTFEDITKEYLLKSMPPDKQGNTTQQKKRN